MRKLIFLLPVLLLACQQATETRQQTMSIAYATTFHLEENGESKTLVVDEPWPNAQTPKRYDLNKPLNRIVCTSTSHLPFFEMLGRADAVVGFPKVSYISSEVFRKRAEDGLLTDVGPDGQINFELLLSLQPDAVVAFDMGGESKSLAKIEAAGIPVYYNADFLESSPLGRAEWIKFFGAILGKEKEADSIFSAVANEYNRLVSLTENIEYRPTVLNGIVYGDTWFMPGGGNWASVFYKNAGGQYLWADDTTSGWLELSFEAVFDRGREADFWIGTASNTSKDELAGAEPRYAAFGPFQNNRVFNYSKRMSPTGGFDFMESGYARPDMVLSDLIKIIHPELLPDYETYYFEQLK